MNEDSKQKRGKILIVVVERDPHLRKLERYFLEQAGYEVEFVDNGIAALARARELHPHLLISEILVPRMDGLSLCRALKSDPGTRSIRVLIFSILSAEALATEAGADAFLRKPLNDVRLVESVEKLLSLRIEEEGGSHGTN